MRRLPVRRAGGFPVRPRLILSPQTPSESLMNNASNPANFRQNAASFRTHASRRPLRVALITLGVAFLILGVDLAQAQPLRQGVAAFNRQDYVLAARIFTPYAE